MLKNVRKNNKNSDAFLPAPDFFRRLMQQRFARSSLWICLIFLVVAFAAEGYSIYCHS